MPARKVLKQAEITLPKPHPGQLALRKKAQNKKIVVISAGRRWGKSFLCLGLVVESCLQNPGFRTVWCAPTFKQCKELLVEFEKAVGMVCNINKTDMKIAFPNGSSCKFLSLDIPDNVRSGGAELIIVDEAAYVDPNSWKALKPMLLGTNGSLWLISSPNGTGNMFAQMFTEAEDKNSIDKVAFTAPTLGCEIYYDEETGLSKLKRVKHDYENPLIEFSEIEDLLKELGVRAFRQEVLGEFLGDQGAVFINVSKCVFPTIWNPEPSKKRGSYVFGIDAGKLHDFTVITVLNELTKEIVFIERFNQLEYQFQYDKITALANKFKPVNIVVEQNSVGEPMIEALRDKGLYITPFLTTNATKKRIIEKLAVSIETLDIKLPNYEELLKELNEYEMKKLPSGMIHYGAPNGNDRFDDCVMSLALAWDQGSWPVTSKDVNVW
jgi:terminase large subunit-like protein